MCIYSYLWISLLLLVYYPNSVIMIRSISCSHGNDAGVYVSPGAAISTLAGTGFMICLENTLITLDFCSSSSSWSVLMLEKTPCVCIWVKYTGRTIFFIEFIFHFSPLKTVHVISSETISGDCGTKTFLQRIFCHLKYLLFFIQKTGRGQLWKPGRHTGA